jgi:hypothetical protein
MTRIYTYSARSHRSGDRAATKAKLIFCPHQLSQDPRAVEVERSQSHAVNELYPVERNGVLPLVLPPTVVSRTYFSSIVPYYACCAHGCPRYLNASRSLCTYIFIRMYVPYAKASAFTLCLRYTFIYIHSSCIDRPVRYFSTLEALSCHLT